MLYSTIKNRLLDKTPYTDEEAREHVRELLAHLGVYVAKVGTPVVATHAFGVSASGVIHSAAFNPKHCDYLFAEGEPVGTILDESIGCYTVHTKHGPLRIPKGLLREQA